MGIKTWTLLDVSKGICLEQLAISAGSLGKGLERVAVTQRRLKGGLSEGVDVVRIDNGRLVVDVLPTRGVGLWKAWIDGHEIGWCSPVRGPVHPSFVPLSEDGGLGWLDGFDELLVRCGLESNGSADLDEAGRVLFPLHGRIANRPAHYVRVSVDDNTGEIMLEAVVEETRFHFSKLRLTSTLISRVGERNLQIRDKVENLSASPAGVQLLYHVNFGKPLLEPGSRFVAPVECVVPRDQRAAEDISTWDLYGPETPGFAEQVYFMRLFAARDGMSHTLLRDCGGSRGVSIRFNQEQLPCYTLWKNTISSADGYVTGLEPGTNFPNARRFEARNGRVVNLAPGAARLFDLVLEMHTNPTEVSNAEAEISALQGETEPEIWEEPKAGWCGP